MPDPLPSHEFPAARAVPMPGDGGDLSPSPDGQLAQLTSSMFVADEQLLLNVSFPTAQARLADLTRGGLLATASSEAYSGEITGLARAGPLAFAPGASRLAQVHLQELTAGDDSARLALRWEVIDPAGGLFPVLDADITLTPAGAHATRLMLAAVYRLPPGTECADHDRALLHRAAAAITRAFINPIAQAIGHPAAAAEPGPQAADPAQLPPDPGRP